MIKRALLPLAAALAWTSVAFAQNPPFPASLPPGTFVGNLSPQAAPARAVPLSTLKSQLASVAETKISDANYTATSSDSIIVYTALTATRTVTLAAASSFAPGTQIQIIDRSGSASPVTSVLAVRSGSDTVNGGTSVTALAQPFAGLAFETDGSSKWTAIQIPSLSITQASPTSGSITGTTPFAYNQVQVTNQIEVVPNGLYNAQLTGSARAADVRMFSGYPNEAGSNNAISLTGEMLVTGSNSGTAMDRIAVFGFAYVNKTMTGGGFLEGGDFASLADTGGAYGVVAGIQVETGVNTGATVTDRIGVEITNDYASQGSSFDAALAIDNGVAGGAFQNGISFGSPVAGGAIPINAGGNLFVTNQTFTVANVLEMSNLTVTGKIFDLPHLQVAGSSGVITAYSTSAAPLAGPSGTQIIAANTTPFVVADSSNTSPGAFFLSRASRGSIGSPSALQSGDNIGGFMFEGYGATGYSSNARAAIFGYAAQTWTDSNQGTYLTLVTTPNNSTTQAVRGRIENDGGLMWPDTVTGGSKGAGTINATSYYVVGNLVLAPLSYTSPISYNSGTGAVSLTTPLAVSFGGTGDTGTAFTTFSPTVTASAGTITSSTVNAARYKTIGKLVIAQWDVSITNNGTGSGHVRFTLPVNSLSTSGANYACIGVEWNVTGKSLNGLLGPSVGSQTFVSVAFYDNTYPGGTGSNDLTLTCVYESI